LLVAGAAVTLCGLGVWLSDRSCSSLPASSSSIETRPVLRLGFFVLRRTSSSSEERLLPVRMYLFCFFLATSSSEPKFFKIKNKFFLIENRIIIMRKNKLLQIFQISPSTHPNLS
jgi:hypothetical protein